MRFLFGLLTVLLAQAQPLVIRNVTAIDFNGPRQVTVVINAGKIAAVGAGVKAPPKARILDGKGKFLIPGLWDMHVHLWDKQPMLGLYVAAGVTGIRDMGSDPERTLALRGDIQAGRLTGPLIYTPGRLVDGPGSRITQAQVITVQNANEARSAVDRVDLAGYDFIKVMSRMSADAYTSLAQRARLRRAVFAGHVPEAVSITDAIDARQKSIEHLFGMALGCSYAETGLRQQRLEALQKRDQAALRYVRDRTYATFSSSQCAELFRRMVRYGVWQTPTLTLRKRMSLLDVERLATAEELKFVPAEVSSGWKDPREELKQATPEQLADFRKDYDFHRELVSQMHRAGVGILPGTDTGDPYVVPGFSLHDELEYLVEAGLLPLQAIAAATINPARYFNLERTHGSIERGKVADLVLLEADPLGDIRNTRRISAVVVNGRLFNRKQLDSLLNSSPVQQTKAAPKR